MAKSSKKKPAHAASASTSKPADGKTASPLVKALRTAGTRPSDAGFASANDGGKGSSAKKGR